MESAKDQDIDLQNLLAQVQADRSVINQTLSTAF